MEATPTLVSTKKFNMEWWTTSPKPITVPLPSPAVSLFIVLAIIIIIILSSIVGSNYENKSYDPYGQGIRFMMSRDDTGSPSSNLEERRAYPVTVQPLNKSTLTSTPESPNFSEYYGIDASLKNGQVMIERENFENLALNMNELEKANKGL
jgi:hypothetical protein